MCESGRAKSRRPLPARAATGGPGNTLAHEEEDKARFPYPDANAACQLTTLLCLKEAMSQRPAQFDKESILRAADMIGYTEKLLLIDNFRSHALL
jgi:hypothetical protein